MVDAATAVNQALLDAAEWAGVSVWTVIGAMGLALLVVLLLAFYLATRGSKSSIKVYTASGEEFGGAIEYVERTLAEFPAENVRIEASKGNIIIKLISARPIPEEPQLPQEIKGEPLPSKVEEAPEEPEPESEPIPVGAADSEPEEEKSE